jgi:hypothetical protein
LAEGPDRHTATRNGLLAVSFLSIFLEENVEN